MSKGAITAAISYNLCWIFPISFKALRQVPSEQVVAHRIIWSFLFLISLVAVRRDISPLKSALKLPTLLIYLATGILLAIDWLALIIFSSKNYLNYRLSKRLPSTMATVQVPKDKH